MTALNVGDKFPSDVKFKYIPYTDETSEVTTCGVPIDYDASKEFSSQKIILVSVPGAFTPTCQKTHLSGYLEKRAELKMRGVSHVVVIAYNDPFVMSAWGKANGVKDDFFLFMTDPGTAFSQSIGWTAGERTGRYAIVIHNGEIMYAKKEDQPGVDVSGVDAVLAKL